MNRLPSTDLATAAHAALVTNSPMAAWDDQLRNAVSRQLDEHHYREMRFLIIFGSLLAVLSLVVDYIVAFDNFTNIT